jgi:C_GCAxxG_C_C family probable redox protein
MDIADLNKLYDEGYDCAQCVIFAMKDSIEVSNFDELMRSVSCLGMGLFEGSACGAVLAAYVLIGLKYGNDRPDFSAKGLALIKKEQFMAELRKKHGKGISCPEIMGLDIRKEEDNFIAQRDRIYTEFCPGLCLDVVSALEKVL